MTDAERIDALEALLREWQATEPYCACSPYRADQPCLHCRTRVALAEGA